MRLIECIEKVCKEEGISRMEFARRANIPYTTLANFYSKGADNIKLSTLKKLAAFLNCSIDYLTTSSKTTGNSVDLYELLNSENRLTFGGKEIDSKQREKIKEMIRILCA